MKYLKKYEGFYNEDFQTIKENFGKIESDEAVSTDMVDNESEESEESEDDCEDENCTDCADCRDGAEKVEEGAIRKFFTGHESSSSKGEAMASFHKALDEAEAAAKANPEGYVFNRASLESKAKDNNYRGGLRIQTGGRDKSKKYVIYDEGTTGFQKVASGSGSQTLGS